ncbi:MAG TPA: hypothetical protein PLD62_10655 [Candidatus Cloacimonadota bacterium]|nr:hypothetical protein [Candidatus Cloacimonadota bacterium]
MKKFSLILLLFLLPVLLFCEEFSNPQKYGWTSPEKLFSQREDLGKRQKLLQIYNLEKQDISTNLVRSTLIPGWGQYSAHRYTKGQIFVVSEVILFGGSFLYYRDAMDDFDKYKTANYIGDMHKFYDRSQKKYQNAQILLFSGLALWIYNIYDSIATTEAYNNEVWEKLREENHKTISLDLQGISLRF